LQAVEKLDLAAFGAMTGRIRGAPRFLDLLESASQRGRARFFNGLLAFFVL